MNECISIINFNCIAVIGINQVQLRLVYRMYYFIISFKSNKIICTLYMLYLEKQR